MSTWNPYTVVIIESELRLRREGIFTSVLQVSENALARVSAWLRGWGEDELLASP